MSAAAIATSAALVPASVRADLTLNLRLASGGTTAFIGGDQTNTDIPIQVWATVTGAQTLSPLPAGGTFASDPQVQSGLFDGLQYVYYNVTNSNAAGTYITGGIDAATGKTPVLDPYTKFAASGSQVGTIANIVGGVSLGSTSTVTQVAKPRAANAIFDNTSYYNQSSGLYQQLGNDGVNISASSNTSSFLLETFNFKPTAYAALNQTTFSLSVPTALVTANNLAPANWFQDITKQNLGTGSDPTASNASGGAISGTSNGTPTLGTSVTIQDTLPGDADLNGTVGLSDFAILRKHYGLATGATWAQGDFNHDGAVGLADFAALRANYGQTVTATRSVVVATPAVRAAASSVSGAKTSVLLVSPLSAGSAGPNVVTATAQTPPSGEVELVVYTNTGDAQLLFNNATLSGYEVDSASGELVLANWKPLSSQASYSGNGFGTVLNSSNGLAEISISKTLPTMTSGTIDLGNIFTLNVPAASRDLTFGEVDGNGNYYTVDVDYVLSSTPEPASLLLCGSACAGLLGRRRRAVATRMSPQ